MPNAPITTTPYELGTGRYRVQLTDAGGGLSSWDWIALNRWPGDAAEDAHGFFIYLRDADDDTLWSAGLQPTVRAPERYVVTRSTGQFVIERDDHGIASQLTIAVDGANDLETRTLAFHNHSGRPRRIEVTSYIEVALAPRLADLEHPAFLKLFVQTERLAGRSMLIAKRRPRSRGEPWPAVFHALIGAPAEGWETDRLRFIGRGRDVANPLLAVTGTVGNVLDPIFSLRTTLSLAPGERREIQFVLGAAQEHSAIPALADRLAVSTSVAQSPIAAAVAATFTSGFNDDASEYAMQLPWAGASLALPPMPWLNVLANPRFGGLISETGAGATWSRNSQANRLTPWSNDPVSDPHGEALYLRDDASGAFWSPLPGPAPAPVTYEARHGFGYSRFSSQTNELEQEVTVFVAQHDPVKIVRLRLVHRGLLARRLSFYSYQRLVLGTLPAAPGSVSTWQDGALLCASNTGRGDFGDGIVFTFTVAETAADVQVGCDRRTFIGVDGNVRTPLALRRPKLDGSTGDGLDPCFARQLSFVLQPGESAVFSVVLGEALSEAELATLAARYHDCAAIDAAFAEVSSAWADSLGALQIKTPAPEIDAMVNGWLPYQALACRIWARTAFYQSSGAYGFRDQLQDAGNLSLLWPALTRQQLLLHASRQFAEGDVLHWWHEAPQAAVVQPTRPRGVRTRFSDDLLWLPYVTADYLRSTGDHAVLDVGIPFLSAPELSPEEEERYFQPDVSSESGSVFEHCCRALDRSLTRGAHGLPLMGTGDWNDGMNRVGRKGRGESVWMGFFLYTILADFIPLAQARDEPERAARYHAYREQLALTLNGAGWDGAWYRRAYYDDGTPLGNHDGSECRIDGLAQAWAVLSGAAPAARAVQAMSAAETQLISESEELIRLLTPPFVETPHDPGYIRGYVAGVRENGGQYTHAACWVVAALAKLGRRDRAARLLTMLSPMAHSRDAAAVARYKVEPYVIAADVYGAEPHIGRGGWTWYTGSAGWAYRVALESVLGLRLENGDTLVLSPCVPDDWPEYRIHYRHPASGTTYDIEVDNPTRCSAGVIACSVDDTAVLVVDGTARIAIAGDGAKHRLRITLGPRAAVA
ncbi:MAG: glycosyl transferase [Nevskia sp.]|jgi:cyclic beta-1,2-glucan synthetase|nr:glycosyl transferase [Nevskia sp.]